jgi:predicted outer membrane protein
MLAIDPGFLWRRLWGPAVTTLALVFLDASVALGAEPSVPSPPNGLLSDTGKGTISAADRDFVIKVRLAGLWEIPAGEMAQQKASDPRIKEIGRSISAQHVALDALDRAAAKKLGITLPGKPNSDQQKWLGEMRDANGEEFDKIYIDRLRAAHGKIFPAIATIRTSTRNDSVRKLAQQANQFVMTHLTLLESSGIVDFKALPTAPAPDASASRSAPALNEAAVTRPQSRGSTPLMLLALIAGLAAGVLATAYVTGKRSRTRIKRW